MEERLHDRLVVDRTVNCRSFRGEEQVIVHNLSPAGCMIERTVGQFSPGETLVLTLVSAIEASGQVAWQEGPVSGVRFSALVPERIVAYLGFNAPTGFRHTAVASGAHAKRA